MAGTAPGGIRLVFYGGHIRVGGSPAWRTNNQAKVFINAVSRSNGAIGNDGPYAIFPDGTIAQKALSALLQTPGYSAVPVRQMLLDFAWTPRSETRIQFLAQRALAESDAFLGDLDPESIDRLSSVISMAGDQPRRQTGQADASSRVVRIYSEGFTDSYNAAIPVDQVGAVHLMGSPHSPRWAQRVFAAASSPGGAGAGTSAAADYSGVHYLGFPDNWQPGVWYQQQPDGTYSVSPSQDPQHDGSVGIFARYDGQNSWDIYGVGPRDNNPTPVPPQDQDGNYYSVNTYTFDDGTKMTQEHYPPDVVPDVAGDCMVVPASNGGTNVTCLTPPPADAGTAPADGGTAPADGGTAPADGGTAPADGGGPPGEPGGGEPPSDEDARPDGQTSPFRD